LGLGASLGQFLRLYSSALQAAREPFGQGVASQTKTRRDSWGERAAPPYPPRRLPFRHRLGGPVRRKVKSSSAFFPASRLQGGSNRPHHFLGLRPVLPSPPRPGTP